MWFEIDIAPYLQVDGRFWCTLADVQLREFDMSWIADSIDWDYEPDETDSEIVFLASVQVEHEEIES